MPHPSFYISIHSPEAAIYEGEVTSLIAPAELGYLGVLANHAPLIANLVPGKIVLKTDSDETAIFYSKEKGFLEVFKNNATLLLDSVESAA